MALIQCSECGKEVSDLAVQCPHCGVPVVGDMGKKVEAIKEASEAVSVMSQRNIAGFFFWAGVLGLIGSAFFGGKQTFVDNLNFFGSVALIGLAWYVYAEIRRNLLAKRLEKKSAD